MDYRGGGKPGMLRRYTGSERNYRIMLDNDENPIPRRPTPSIAGDAHGVLGGRTLHWARATDRMADYEFKAASRDGYGMDWAVTYADMKPYYDRVESFIGVSASRKASPSFPMESVSAADAAELRRSIFTAAAKVSGGAPLTAASRSSQVACNGPSALPLLRQLRERLRRRRHVQYRFDDTAARAEDAAISKCGQTAWWRRCA